MKMKQRKGYGILLVLGCLMLTGCADAPYELTEEERQLIVSYSAHVVSKFNRYQKDGLTHVPNLEEELREEEETQQPSETEQDGSDGETGVSGEPTDADNVPDMIAFDNAFADTGLTFSYLSSEIMESYMEDDSYAVNANSGKTLFVLNIRVENPTEEAVVLNNMTSGDVYNAKYVLDSGKTYNAEAVMTLLLNDFTTYEGTIEAQSSVDMIIVFEIPAETETVSDLKLQVRRKAN